MSNKKDKKFEARQGYNRVFSEAFKKAKVKDIVAGVIKVKEVSDLYQVSRTSVYKWLYLYSNAEKGVKTVVEMESEQYKTQLLKQRVAELERSVGQKQLEIDFLSCCLKTASDELGYDIKKKYAPASWSSSEQEKGENQKR